MRDILPDLAVWFAGHERFVLATVIRTWQSAPRPAGAAMAVSESGSVVGSLSGGCVEGALYELAGEVLADGVGRTVTFTVDDGDALGVGLTCGGTIVVRLRLITRHTFPDFHRLPGLVAGGEPVAVVTDLRDPEPSTCRHMLVTADSAWGAMPGATGACGLVDRVRDGLRSGESGLFLGAACDGQADVDAPGIHPAPAPATATVDSDSGTPHHADQVMVEIFGTAPKMYVFGAIDFAAAMSRMGKFAGYHVTVVDARPVFATPERFPDADEVVVRWPHRFLAESTVDERTVITVLTHDEKFDIPLLELALRTDAAYVGALGSRATHERRVKRLLACGVDDEALDRLHSPIGLDLGARTPEETAISIMAEVLTTSRGATGLELRSLKGPIHRERGRSAAHWLGSGRASEGC